MNSEENNNQEQKLSFFRSMRGKLVLWFLLLTLVPLAIVGGLAYIRAQDALQQAAFEKLAAVRDLKREEINKHFILIEDELNVLAETAENLQAGAIDEFSALQNLKVNALTNYFEELQNDISIVKDDPYVWQAFEEFHEAVEAAETGEVDAETGRLVDWMALWDTAAATYDSRMQDIVMDFGWYDIFLIAPDGDIVYTAARESDLYMNINGSQLATQGIGKAFNAAKSMDDEEVALSDYAPYSPSNGDMAAFMVARMVDEDGVLVGYVGLQVPTDEVNAIVQDRVGMPDSGESYLVGAVSGGAELRSDRVVKEGNLGDAKSGADVDSVLSGQSGYLLKVGSSGDYEISVYTPIDVHGLNWGLISTAKVVEILVPKLEGADQDYFQSIKEHYGYYDIFLIEPSGQIFYTVEHEADYMTNILTGAYKDSNLGELTARVLETNAYALADFAPYEPSGGVPAAFAAIPILDQGEVNLIVAVQLSLEKIDNVMQERSGMGETGETYLVGPDFLMRSDSFLDPTNHSVEASFAGTVALNGVDTVAVEEGLAGREGEQIINDYRGEKVLSAFEPMDVSGLQWVIVAEINQSEAFAAANTLRDLILAVMAIAAVVVVAISLMVATSLANPIMKITGVSQEVAAGNLDVEVDVKSSDETGILANAFRTMIERLKQMIANEQDARERLESTVEDYSAFMTNVARGNLSSRLTIENGNGTGAEDPLVLLGENLNETTASLQDMISQITEASTNLSSASSEILAATTQQASGANEQSAAITQTTTTVDEVKTISEQSIERAQEVVDTSQRTVDVSRTGQDIVVETISSMGQIKERVEGIAENILALSEQTQQIGEIIAAVNEISSQSNILALNASVEAARAGEHGKGFGVVAVEVRNLAEQSRQATEQVKAILLDIQNAINATVMATEEGTKVVDQGVQLASQTQEIIEQLSKVIDETAQTSMQMMAGGRQQSSGVEQISVAMTNINQATTQGLASTKQAEKAAQDLNALAQQLTGIVEQYEV